MTYFHLENQQHKQFNQEHTTVTVCKHIYKPLFNSMEEVFECPKGCSFSPDAQAAHVDHVLWLRGA